MNGFINIVKPPGMTSHDVVSFVRSRLKVKSGHTGTLDPAAAGVLVIATGRGTKLSSFVTNTKKSYRVELTLGQATNTGDSTGDVIEENEVPPIQIEQIKKVFKKFIGVNEQTPPMFSAVHYKGKRLYELARKGIEVERPARKITIYDLKFLKKQNKSIMFDVECSSGTYVRVLCIDLAKELKTVGYMSFLVRTKVGVFTLDETCTLEEIAQYNSNTKDFFLPLDYPLFDLPYINLSENDAKKATNGNTIITKYNGENSNYLRLYHEDKFIALGSIIEICEGETFIKPKVVLV